MQKHRMHKTGRGDFHHIDWGGSGPLAHFAHATGFCAGLYTPLVERLRSQLRVVGMDDRGHGRTRAPADPAQLRDWDVFAEDLERFFVHLGEPVIAMGHSRGAVTSLLVAVRRPQLIRALVLIDPTILPFSLMGFWFLAKRMGLAKFVPIAHRAARRRDIWPDRETLLNSYRNKGPFRSWKKGFLEAYVAECTACTTGGMIRLSCDPAWESRCFAACPHDVWRHIPQIRHPTLVLYGTRSDTFLAPAVRRFKAKAPGTTFQGFERTSHFVPMERPGESAEAIFNFLKKHRIL